MKLKGYKLTTILLLLSTKLVVGNVEASCFESAIDLYPLKISTDLHYSILVELANLESSNRHLGRHPVTKNHPCCDYGRMGINRWWESRVTHKQWRNIVYNDCANVKFGAFVLKECVDRLGATARGIGCYHSPNKRRAEKYGKRVLKRVKEEREARNEW